MKSIKTSISAKLAALLVGTALIGLVSQCALAAGTAAGTSISNTASLNYSVGGVGQTQINSTSAAFLVDEKVNLTVAGGVTTNVVPGASAQATAFTVTNNSNSPLDFTLAVVSAIAGDNFDPTACNAFVDVNGNGTYEPLTDTATYIDELAADASKTVFAVCNIPAGATNTQTGLVGMVATAIGTFNAAGYVATPGAQGAALVQTAGADTLNVDIVFADIAGSDDAARDAKHSARNTYSVLTAALTVTKTAALLCDPFNGNGPTAGLFPKNIPGAITQWTITVSNGAAGAPATLTTISDTLAATLAHDANLVTGLTAATCVSGAPGVPESLAGRGFKVTVPVARILGGSLAGSGTTSYFTTATADGLDIAGQVITATFGTILPIDGATGHATAGLLNANESVSIIFNTTVQ